MAELLLETADPLPDVTDETVGGLDRIGEALADPKRRRILQLLLDGPQCPSELADAIGTSRSNLSNHLACLRGCGLIVAEKTGRHLYYHLTSEEFAQALRSLIAIASVLPECDDQIPASTSTTTLDPGMS